MIHLAISRKKKIESSSSRQFFYLFVYVVIYIYGHASGQTDDRFKPPVVACVPPRYKFPMLNKYGR